MTDKHAFCVMLQIETTDPRLSVEAMAEAMQSAGGVARLRHAVLQHLPKDVARLIAVFPVEQAKMLMKLHEAVGEDIAEKLREKGLDADPLFQRPPSDYVPPTQE
jgi:hypothetical protein